jgi:hypothetical protein
MGFDTIGFKPRIFGRLSTMTQEKKPRMTVLAGSGGVLIPAPPLPEPEVKESPPAPVKEPGMGVKLMHKAKEMSDKGESKAAICKEMGKSENWVEGTLLIMNRLPPKVLEAIDKKLFSRTCALQLLLAPAEKLDAIIDGAIKLAEVEGKL